MRISITYETDRIPLSYRMKIYSLIKEAVKHGNTAYYERIFEEGRREIKNLSFATFLKDFKIEDNEITLKEMTITVSSTTEFIIFLFNGLQHQILKEYKVEGAIWKQKRIQMLREAEITTSSAVFSTLSPILIEDQSGKPLLPTDEEYEKELNYYANLQVRQAEGRDLHQSLRFTPIQMRRQVIKESNRVFRKSHGEQSLYYTAHKGTFRLEGHPEDLQILYRYGIGKSSQFFGLLDLIV